MRCKRLTATVISQRRKQCESRDLRIGCKKHKHVANNNNKKTELRFLFPYSCLETSGPSNYQIALQIFYPCQLKKMDCWKFRRNVAFFLCYIFKIPNKSVISINLVSSNFIYLYLSETIGRVLIVSVLLVEESVS